MQWWCSGGAVVVQWCCVVDDTQFLALALGCERECTLYSPRCRRRRCRRADAVLWVYVVPVVVLLVQVAPEFRGYTLEEFSWARMMVASRNFGITIGDVKTDALVPLADMLNHYRPRETKWVPLLARVCEWIRGGAVGRHTLGVGCCGCRRWQFENAADSFTITSLERLSAGHQVRAAMTAVVGCWGRVVAGEVACDVQVFLTDG